MGVRTGVRVAKSARLAASVHGRQKSTRLKGFGLVDSKRDQPFIKNKIKTCSYF
jgi:hypothetical protein